jgi:hypothetical protein
MPSFMLERRTSTDHRMMMLPMVRDITVEARAVKIAVDWMSVERVLHLNKADVEPSPQGHSTGHWEGETLLVDTVAFTPNRSGVVPGGPGQAHGGTVYAHGGQASPPVRVHDRGSKISR